jgi:hypothetical protein
VIGWLSYAEQEAWREGEHAFARQFGFYRAQCWYIDRLIEHPGEYYRYTTIGRNGHAGGDSFCWRVPNLDNRAYAFALRVIA